MNCNLSHRSGLSDVCDVFGLTNLVKEPTCFKGDTPTLVDVFLTNRPKCFSGVINVDIGTSDFHNYVGVVSRAFAPRQIRRKITYRSMKNFQEDAFRAACDNIPFHVSNVFEDIDDIYWAHSQVFLSVLNEHAPLKTKWIKKEQVPYMNSELRKAIHQRNMWRNKHFKNKRDKLARQNYVKLRSNVVKLKKRSIQTYFDRKCNTQFGGKDFYKTVKLFLSDKGTGSSGSNIILREDDVLITDPIHVADVFNKYYASIAEYDSVPDGLDRLTFSDAIAKHKNHESIILIRNRIVFVYEFTFQVISPETFSKYINKLQNNKAVGHDGLKATSIKLSGTQLCSSLCEIFNACITTSSFPSEMKLADISPIFKKDDSLCKENYRSVNLLTIVSKLFENIMSDQLTDYFRNLLCSSLSAYRKGYNCQHVIFRLTEYWRQALDNGNTVGTIAMDLSRALDKMPYALLIAKLNAYGLSEDACNLIINYLTNRRHRVKISGTWSHWATINHGVPQGSVLGPLLFNIFLNDLFYVNMTSEIANYADDNHLYYEDKCYNVLRNVLENDVLSATAWFDNNYMCANPDKFQSIILSRDGQQSLSISVQDNTILSDTTIKVLGVTLDNRLKFDKHVSTLCMKASRQINALKRISKYLDENCRILIFKSFISSSFDYCPVSWMFCGKTNLNKLEKLQERVLRFVFRDTTSSYESLLERGNFLPFSAYRIRCLGIKTYKCFHGPNPDYLNNLFKQSSIKYNLRDSCRLEQSKFNTFSYGQRSFQYYGSKLWNLLPFSVKNTNDLNMFKTNITRWCYSKQCASLDAF